MTCGNDPSEKENDRCASGCIADETTATNLSWEHGLCTECYNSEVVCNPDMLIPHLIALRDHFKKLDSRVHSEADHFKVILDYLKNDILSSDIQF
jgi:hypothetical protein